MNAGPRENRPSLFATSLTDHLQIGYAQVAIFFFGRRVLNLAFFLFLCFLLRFRFAMSETR